MRSSVQQTMLECLNGILKPIVRLLLLCGIGYKEFAAVAKTAFVQVASEEYGIRGRPTNASRIAAMTGLSRKEVGRIRTDAPVARWNPDMASTPMSAILHYWHYDPDFSEVPGKPKALPLEGDLSFATLVKRYGGDIPAGAMRAELARTGVVLEESRDTLSVVKRYAYTGSFHEDDIRKAAYSLGNLASTVAYNAVVRGAGAETEIRPESGRFERFAHSDWLAPGSVREFEYWVRSQGAEFLERANHWLGINEIPREFRKLSEARNVGVGLYFYFED